MVGQSLVNFNAERHQKNDGIVPSGVRFRQIRADTPRCREMPGALRERVAVVERA